MSTKTLLRSFAGGEIAPEMLGRVELAKFQTGLGLCRNAITLPHGPLDRRPGFRYIQQGRFQSPGATLAVRIIPFAFSADQTMVLEFSDGKVRFLPGGGTLLQANIAVTGWSFTSPALFSSIGHGLTSGRWVYFAAPGAPQLNSQFFLVQVIDADTFTLQSLGGQSITGVGLPAWSAGATVAPVYEIDSPYSADELFEIHYAQNSDILTLVHPAHPIMELRRLGATNWELAPADLSPPSVSGATLTATATIGTSTNLSPQEYAISFTLDDGVTETLQAATDSTSNNLAIAGNYNTLTWTGVPAGATVNVYKRRGGVWGYIGEADGSSLVDDNVLPDTTRSPPKDIIELNAGPGNYPSAVTYHEQRRWFAGTTEQPQSIFATRSATESNMTSSTPTVDDDAMEFRIAALQQNAIRHLVPLSDLLALTAGGEWRIFSDNAPAITPSTLSIKPQGFTGASNVQPALAGNSVMYAQAQGSRIRELSYNWETSAYRSVDVTLFAPHLFVEKSVVDIAYQRAPDQILWVVRSDGVLLGLSYVPEQQVYGWHQHVTDGAFESVCVVAEGSRDVLYAVVRRQIDGRTVRYIERLDARFSGDLAGAFFVDSGKTYAGSPATDFHGLRHLEGKVVQVLADGAVEPVKTVVDGRIVLDHPASRVHVGLQFTTDAKTLPLAFEGAQAAGQGTMKNVNNVHLRVVETSLLKIGPSFGKLRPNRSRDTTDPYDSPPSPKTGEIKVAIDGQWSPDGPVCIRQDEPLPMRIASMTLEVAIGG